MNEVDPPDYKSLGDLRMEGVSIGALATAIERYGIYGWDRYNRFRKVAPDDAVAKAALGALARAADDTGDPRREVGYEDPVGSPWREAGWPENDLPDFVALSGGLHVRRSRDSGGPADSALLLIAALRALLVRESGTEGRSRFTSDAQLISHIVAEHPDIRGLSERTIQELLPKAKRLLTERRKE